jgi:adenylate cyclase
MGVHVGDIILQAGDIYGAGVNVAARLQELAEPGSLMISGAVREQVGANLQLPLVDLGDVSLRNIANPVRAIRVATSPAQGRPRIPAGVARGQPAIAVLPFSALDSDSEKAYFGASIVEDIIASLAALEELRVISRGSTLRYRGTDVDLRQVRLDLGVRYVLTGSVRRDGRRYRITAELIDVETGLVLWAHSYKAENQGLFDVQDRIITQVVGTIAPRVQAAEVQRAFQKRPESMDAYDHVLQARHLLWRLEAEEFARAGTLLRRAIALDDTYAAAYALTSQWHGIRNLQGWSPDVQADARESIRLAEAAVERDSFSALALAHLGHYKSFYSRDYYTAIALFDRALSASPNSAWAWGLSSPTYSYIGDGYAAITRAERALSLSPLDPLAFWYHTSLCLAHYTNGSYREAAKWGQIALRGNPRYGSALRHTAAALSALGQAEEAFEIAHRVLDSDPNYHVSDRVARYPYRDERQRDLLQRHLLAAGLPP